MAVSASFHKNMHLLSQLASPTEAFKMHYREGMFEKPNTIGFIHATHFLLSLYDIERFRKLVEWPIVCKKSEAKYRNDVKDFIGIVAAEHPQAAFPSNLATHLLHPGGMKFIRIMWKLSRVVLYVYLSRDVQADVLAIPQPGIAETATKALLNKSISRNYKSIIEIEEKVSKTESEFKKAAEQTVDEIQSIRGEFFERRKAVCDAASRAPVASVVKKRLIDTEDEEIIEMWRKNIQTQISDLREKNEILKSIGDLSQEVADLSNSLLGSSKTLDASKLPTIDTTTDLHSMVSPESQVSFCRIYIDGQLSLINLSKTVLAVLRDLAEKLRTRRLQNLADCREQINASNEDMISMRNLFAELMEESLNLTSEIQHKLTTDNANSVLERTYGILGVMNDALFMSSPIISIDTNTPSNLTDIRNRLALTPVEGAHKTLFARHRRTRDTTPQSSKMKTNLLISRLNFDDTMSSTKTDKTTPRQKHAKVPSRLQMSLPKISDKYSRLFSGYRKTSNHRANSSTMSIPLTPKANSTTLINTISESNSIPEMSLDFTVKSIFNLSHDIISAVSVINNPSRNTPDKQNKSGTAIADGSAKKENSEKDKANYMEKICESDKSLEVEDLNCEGESSIIESECKVGGNIEETVVQNDNKHCQNPSADGLSTKVIRPLLDDEKEIEVIDTGTPNRKSPTKHQRRSIGDLVERYKKILEKSTISTMSHSAVDENGDDAN